MFPRSLSRDPFGAREGRGTILRSNIEEWGNRREGETVGKRSLFSLKVRLRFAYSSLKVRLKFA